MDLKSEQLDGDGIKVVLTGRLDIAGSAAVDLRLSTLAGAYRGMVVDMSGVSFLSSIGIRTLVVCAKALKRRGGGLVLLAPQPEVAEVLEVTGILEILPVAASEAEALKAIGA